MSGPSKWLCWWWSTCLNTYKLEILVSRLSPPPVRHCAARGNYQKGGTLSDLFLLRADSWWRWRHSPEKIKTLGSSTRTSYLHISLKIECHSRLMDWTGHWDGAISGRAPGDESHQSSARIENGQKSKWNTGSVSSVSSVNGRLSKKRYWVEYPPLSSSAKLRCNVITLWNKNIFIKFTKGVRRVLCVYFPDISVDIPKHNMGYYIWWDGLELVITARLWSLFHKNR